MADDGRVSFTTKELAIATISVLGAVISWGWWILSTEARHYQEFILFRQHVEDTLIKNQDDKLDDLSSWVKQAVDDALKKPPVGPKP